MEAQKLQAKKMIGQRKSKVKGEVGAPTNAHTASEGSPTLRPWEGTWTYIGKIEPRPSRSLVLQVQANPMRSTWLTKILHRSQANRHGIMNLVRHRGITPRIFRHRTLALDIHMLTMKTTGLPQIQNVLVSMNSVWVQIWACKSAPHTEGTAELKGNMGKTMKWIWSFGLVTIHDTPYPYTNRRGDHWREDIVQRGYSFICTLVLP